MASLYDDRVVYIYGLCEPTTGHLRYIGRAFDPADRLKKHVRKARYKPTSRVNCWIARVVSQELVPDLFIIEECSAEDWREAENFWMQYFRMIGCSLLNDQIPDLCGARYTSSEETRAKMSAAHKGVRHSEERRANSRTNRKRGQENHLSASRSTPEQREAWKQAHVRANLGKPLTEEHKAKCGEALRGRKFTEEHRTRMSESIKKALRNTELVARDPQGRERRFPNMAAFLRESGISRKLAKGLLLGKDTTATGWILWKPDAQDLHAGRE